MFLALMSPGTPRYWMPGFEKILAPASNQGTWSVPSSSSGTIMPRAPSMACNRCPHSQLKIFLSHHTGIRSLLELLAFAPGSFAVDFQIIREHKQPSQRGSLPGALKWALNVLMLKGVFQYFERRLNQISLNIYIFGCMPTTCRI